MVVLEISIWYIFYSKPFIYILESISNVSGDSHCIACIFPFNSHQETKWASSYWNWIPDQCRSSCPSRPVRSCHRLRLFKLLGSELQENTEDGLSPRSTLREICPSQSWSLFVSSSLDLGCHGSTHKGLEFYYTVEEIFRSWKEIWAVKCRPGRGRGDELPRNMKRCRRQTWSWDWITKHVHALITRLVWTGWTTLVIVLYGDDGILFSRVDWSRQWCR